MNLKVRRFFLTRVQIRQLFMNESIIKKKGVYNEIKRLTKEGWKVTEITSLMKGEKLNK